MLTDDGRMMERWNEAFGRWLLAIGLLTNDKH